MFELKVLNQQIFKSALALTALLLSSSTGCGNDRAEAGAFDESGVWRLTYYDLDPTDKTDPEEPQSTARNGFLLKFDPEKRIVAASACGRTKSSSHSVEDSNCDVSGSDKTRHFECSCFEYTFSGNEMRWKEVGDDDDSYVALEDLLLRQYDDASDDDDSSGDDEKDKKKKKKKKDKDESKSKKDKDKGKKKKKDKDEEEEEESESSDEEDKSGKEADSQAGHLVTVKTHPDKSGTIVFTGLPNKSGKEKAGLFQSNGTTSRHTFQKFVSKQFKRTGCAKACGIDG